MRYSTNFEIKIVEVSNDLRCVTVSLVLVKLFSTISKFVLFALLARVRMIPVGLVAHTHFLKCSPNLVEYFRRRHRGGFIACVGENE